MAAIAAPSRLDLPSLSFHHLHTGEFLSVPYWVCGRYEPGALSEIDKLLRDFRSGETTNMDVGPLEFLHRLRTALASDQPFEIIPGYRSPLTNARLAAKAAESQTATITCRACSSIFVSPAVGYGMCDGRRWICVSVGLAITGGPTSSISIRAACDSGDLADRI